MSRRREAWLLAAPVAAGQTVLGVAALMGGGWIAPLLPPPGPAAAPQAPSSAPVPPPEQPVPAPQLQPPQAGHDLPPPWRIDADGRVRWRTD
jgi:hypothetical protein